MSKDYDKPKMSVSEFNSLRDHYDLGHSRAICALQNNDYPVLLQYGSETTENTTAYVMLSGGIDSTTALYLALNHGNYKEIIGIEFTYDQRPLTESQRVAQICQTSGINRYVINYPTANIVNADGYQCDSIKLPESNGIYYLLTHHLASQIKPPEKNQSQIIAGQIMYDWWAPDYNSRTDDTFSRHKYYPQASPIMYGQLNSLLKRDTGGLSAIEVITPLIFFNKQQVVQIAVDTATPLELTWSCPNSSEKPCGICSQCNERRDAFAANNLNYD